MGLSYLGDLSLTYVLSIMSNNPIKAAEEAKLGTVISLMANHGVGSVIIVDSNDVPSGIITERELLREIAFNTRLGRDPMAKDVMSFGFIRISPQTRVEEAARTMMESGARLVVTRKNGNLVGMVTVSDFLGFFLNTAEDMPITRVIHEKVTTLKESGSLMDAIRLMNEKRIGSVIVVRHTGLPLGIFTERDLVRILKDHRTKEFGSLRLGDLATQPLVSAPLGLTAREAASLMISKGIKRLPILRGERLFGILTARDLVSAYSSRVDESQVSKKLGLVVQRVRRSKLS